MFNRQPLDPALRQLLDEQAAALGPAPSPLMPEAARARSLQAIHMRGPIEGLPQNVTVQDREIPGPAGSLKVRVYTPSPLKSPPPVLVYVHGGGWVTGSLDTYDPICRFLATLSDVQVISVDYRLAPEHPYPAAVEDTHAALAWVAASATNELGSDASRVVLGGDSAGGNVAAVVANRRISQRTDPALRGLMLLFPATEHPDTALYPSWAENATGYGLTADGMRWYWEQYRGQASPGDPGLSPGKAVSLAGLPPAFVATAEYDVLRDEGVAYARRMEETGVAVTHHHAPDMHHNYFAGASTIVRFPQSTAALAVAASWLRSVLA